MLTAVFLVCCDSKEHQVIDLNDRIPDSEVPEMTAKPESGLLRFGFDTRSSPKEDARQYLPFFEYLEQATGLRFKLYFSSPCGSVVEDLGTDVVQFAAIGAGSYLKARVRYGVIPLVRGINAQGRAEYQSVIIVAPDSQIQSIDDLRGKSFAFGCINSTQGHIIPRIILAEHGLDLMDLSFYAYTGSHLNCAAAVAAGHFDAGGMQDTMGRELADKGFIRIIYTSRFFPSSCIAANRSVPPAIIERVTRALLDFDPKDRHADGLYHWERTEMPGGYSEAGDEDYEELCRWSLRFILLEQPGGQ